MCFSFFFSSRRRHTRSYGDWSSDVCSSDLAEEAARLPVELLRPDARLLVPLAPEPLRALVPKGVEAEPPRREHRPGRAPHQLAPLVVGVRRDQLGEAHLVLRSRSEQVQDEQDPRLAPEQASLLGVLGGLARLTLRPARAP